MKVFILVDLEGATGYGSNNVKGNALDFLHSDVNAAIRGAKKADATEIIVGDWHDKGNNLDKKKLSEGVLLEQYDERFSIPEKGIDFAFFVGAHAMAGTKNTVDAHTWEYFVKKAIVDGKEIGEVSLLAYYFSAMKVPLVFVSGSAEAITEAKGILPKAETATVKKAFESLKAEEGAKLIEEKAFLALKKKSISFAKPKKEELLIEYTDGKNALFQGKNFVEILDKMTSSI